MQDIVRIRDVYGFTAELRKPLDSFANIGSAFVFVSSSR